MKTSPENYTRPQNTQLQGSAYKQIIKSADGKILTNPDEIVDAQENYCNDLYDSTDGALTVLKTTDKKKTNIVKSEVIATIKKLKKQQNFWHRRINA